MATENDSEVLAIIANIKKNQESIQPDTKKNKNKPQKVVDENLLELRGKPKSGRFWKEKKERFSSINKTKGLQQDFKKKTLLRLELKRTKELSKQVQDQIKQKEIDRKERRRQNIQKTEENKKKSEVVQVITNSAKLKRLKKKQLRYIQKRDTNKATESSK